MNRFMLPAVAAVLGFAAMSPAQPQLPVPEEVAVAPAPVVRALTVRQFAESDFRAGRYSLYVVHPCTNCPVKVCFCLPACPRAVRSNSNTVVIRWGVLPCRRVAVRFLADGTVSVLD